MKMTKLFFVLALILCVLLSFGLAFARPADKDKKEAPAMKAEEEEVPMETVVLKFTDWQLNIAMRCQT